MIKQSYGNYLLVERKRLEDASTVPAPSPPSEAERVAQSAAVKHAKPRMDLIPGCSLLEVAKVLTFGAAKHAEGSWKRPPFKRSDYVAAIGRHYAAILDGTTIDGESKLLHSAHLACNALMLVWYDLKGGER